MEEKERFELFGEHCIKDNNPDARPQLLDAYVACVILNEQDKENQQLKKQLAEKAQENERLKEEICKYEITLMDKNSQLKQQLDEKEKELSEYVKIVDDLHKQLSDKCDFCDKTKDQDKILFAVEQLEKAKGLIANHTQELWTCENDDIDLVLYEEIDKQIKQLKEKDEETEQLREGISQCDADRKCEQEKKNLAFKELRERSEQLRSQPAEIVEKIKEFVEGNAYYYEEEQYAEHIIKYLDDILKKYQK